MPASASHSTGDVIHLTSQEAAWQADMRHVQDFEAV